MIRLGILILAHTAVRASELTGATWAELDGDIWEIPGERMKMKRPHIVPLSTQVRAMLDELRSDQRFDISSPVPPISTSLFQTTLMLYCDVSRSGIIQR